MGALTITHYAESYQDVVEEIRERTQEAKHAYTYASKQRKLKNSSALYTAKYVTELRGRWDALCETYLFIKSVKFVNK